MKKISAYIAAMRLRTLPLSLSGVVCGLLLAVADYQVSPLVAFFVILTAVFLQISSNTANEYGDFTKGTDTADRKGPAYALSQGLMGEKEYKRMIVVYVILAIISGLVMVRLSFGTWFSYGAIITLLFGAAAISGALKYTLGRNPYGYRGWGDVNVFLYFGLVAVAGSFFVATGGQIPNWFLVFPAASIGCLTTAVLNLNNIRDIETDAATRKTIPVRIGEKNAKIYQTLLIVFGWLFMIAYSFFRISDPWHYLFVITLPLFIIHLTKLFKTSGKALDTQLPFLVLSIFVFAILSGLGYVVYLF